MYKVICSCGQIDTGFPTKEKAKEFQDSEFYVMNNNPIIDIEKHTMSIESDDRSSEDENEVDVQG